MTKVHATNPSQNHTTGNTVYDTRVPPYLSTEPCDVVSKLYMKARTNTQEKSVKLHLWAGLWLLDGMGRCFLWC